MMKMNKKIVSLLIIVFMLTSVFMATGLSADKQSQVLNILEAMGFDTYGYPKPAPDFTLQKLNGGSTTLSNLTQDVIFLSNWTTWCSYCRQEGPSKQAVWERFKDSENGNGFYMIAASHKETSSTVQNYINQYNYTFPVYLDSAGTIKTKYSVSGFPQMIAIIDGQIYGKHPGRGYWDTSNNISRLQQIIDIVGPSITPTPTATPTATQTPTPTATPVLTNLALLKKIVSSSDYSPNYPARSANDGSLSTAWGSQLTTGPEYIYIDLGSIKQVKKVILDWYNPYYAQKFSIAVSNDGVNWSMVYTDTNGTGGQDVLEAASPAGVRYVGVYLENPNDAAFALKEFSIYGYNN